MADKNLNQKKKSKILVYLIALFLIIAGLIWLNKKGEEFKNLGLDSIPKNIGRKFLPSQTFNQTAPTDEQTPNKTANQNSSKEKTISGENENAKNIKEEERTSINDYGTVGSLNHQYLQANPFSRLVLEIDYVDSTPPDQNAVNTFVSMIKQYADKPEGVVLAGGNSLMAQKQKYTSQDLINIAKTNRSSYSSGKTVSLYVLYVNGSLVENENALGVALTSSMFVIFKDQINQAATSLVFSSEIERAVLIHELGHLFGLVNINYQSSIDHEDFDHPHHSNNKESVMYWAIEDISVANILRFGPPYQFDKADKHDIEKIKQREY